MATMSSVKGRSAAATTTSASALDDPNLLSTLVKSAKSSHSTLGRALDTTLSHQRFGGAEMEPSALTMNRRERDRQLRLQQDLQRACGDTTVKAEKTTTSTLAGAPPQRTLARSAAASSSLDGSAAHKGLHIPALPTMAPSMTAAADDGTDSLGGTKIGGDDRGYVTLIGAVPTFATTRQIEDNYELISSFRAYRTDAQRNERQAALRNISAPHPDLLDQLAPLIQQRGDGTASAAQPTLVDVETLPYELRQAYAARQLRSAPTTAPDADAAPDAPVLVDSATAAEEPTVAASAHPGGTWSFTCQGRAAADRVKSLNFLPGQRQPAVGQYYVRYATVEPRVTGGYVTPQVSASAAAGGGGITGSGAVKANSSTRGASNADPRATVDDADDDHRAEASAAGDGASIFGQTMTGGNDGGVSSTERRGTGRAGDDDDAAEMAQGPVFAPGENVKGSSMFLSQVPRQATSGSAAPDVCYWPYPDVRSTAKRTPCLVQLDVPQTHRRREPLVSGVPASVYEVREDIAAHQPRTVTMDRSTGRGTHWYGRSSPPANGEPLDVDEALRATRPKERAAVLPPRTGAGNMLNADDDGGESGTTAEARGGPAVVDTSVSVERNLDYPRPLLGDAAQLAHVRDFGKVRSREEREAQARLGLTVAYQGAYDPYAQAKGEESAREWTEARSRAAVIHPSAPGHQDLHTSSATELGEVPSLALTKPRVGCVTDLGKGSPRPAHMANLHDLTYDTERAYALTGGRVKGTPSIGRTVTRQQAGGPPTEGCGAKVMYNPTDYLAPPVKSVPDFEKQITKEHEFRGHRVQSERYTRLFPSAPGPGHYSPNFSQVE